MSIDQMLHPITSRMGVHIYPIVIFTLLASILLSVWLEREYTYRRRLDDIYEKLEALQQHVVIILTTQHVPPVLQTSFSPRS